METVGAYEAKTHLPKLLDRGRYERRLLGPVRFHTAGKTGLDEAFRAKAQRHIRGERFLAAWANAFGIHIIVASTQFLGIAGERLQRDAN